MVDQSSAASPKTSQVSTSTPEQPVKTSAPVATSAPTQPATSSASQPSSVASSQTPQVKTSNPKTTSKRHRACHWSVRDAGSLVVGILWLAPIIALLVLNATNYIIGPSAWCPYGGCRTDDPLNGISSSLALKNDEADHNLIGALQILAKMLEIWFGFIAASLLYSTTKFLAEGRYGLPIGLTLSHITYTDPSSLLGKQSWGSTTRMTKHTPRRMKLYLLVLLAFMLCGIYSLMGPATAVLMLPTLRWVKTSDVGYQFNDLKIADPPNGPSLLREDRNGCIEANLTNRQYSCRYIGYSDLDMARAAIVSYMRDIEIDHLESTSFIALKERGLSFTFNMSLYETNRIAYVPLRQTIQDLSKTQYGDLGLALSSEKISSHKGIKSVYSLDAPIIWVYRRWNYTTPIVVNLPGGQKTIRCFQMLRIEDKALDKGQSPEGIDCVRTGSGWNPSNKDARFQFNIINKNTPNIEMTVDYYFSDSLVRFPTLDWRELPACINDPSAGSGIECDWENDFIKKASSNFANHLIVEINPGKDKNRIIYEYLFDQSFATYSSTIPADTDQLSVKTNPWDDELIETFSKYQNYSYNLLTVHPDWFLAGWSIDQNGTLDEDSNAAKLFTSTISNFVNLPEEHAFRKQTFLQNSNVWTKLMDATTMQGLSLISYSNMTDFVQLSTLNHQSITKKQPILRKYVTIYTWGWGFSSRSSILGAVVACMGIICTFARTIVCLLRGTTHQLTENEYLTAALEHMYQGELDGLGDSELRKFCYRHEEVNKRLHFKKGDQYSPLLSSP